MKKIITAFANPDLNKAIAQEQEYEVILPDIQYQDGVLEILAENKEVDILILNSILPGAFEKDKFISKIKELSSDLEIIIILEEKNEEFHKFLFFNGITKIFYNDELTIVELIKILKEEHHAIPNEINQEIKMLKEMILNNNSQKNIRPQSARTKITKILTKINILIKKIIKIKTKNKDSPNKIINIIGAGGVGKSIFACILSRQIKNKKILLIDFDIVNNNISTIFGVKKTSKQLNKKINKNQLHRDRIAIEDLIIKINNKLNLICGLEMVLGDSDHINKEELENIIQKIKQLSSLYDVVIIDTNSEYESEYLKEITQNSDKTILLVEPNLLGIKNSKKILETYVHKWKVNKEQMNIIFNKTTLHSIDSVLLKQIFLDFDILGQIKLNKKYNLIINNQLGVEDKKIKKEYSRIINKLNICEKKHSQKKEENINGCRLIKDI